MNEFEHITIDTRAPESVATVSSNPADPVELTEEETAIEMSRIGAMSRLAFARKQSPELVRAEAQARVDLAAAIMAMDEAEGIPGRHNFIEQANVEIASRKLLFALADLIRGEADSSVSLEG